MTYQHNLPWWQDVCLDLLIFNTLYFIYTLFIAGIYILSYPASQLRANNSKLEYTMNNYNIMKGQIQEGALPRPGQILEVKQGQCLEQRPPRRLQRKAMAHHFCFSPALKAPCFGCHKLATT